MAVGYAPCLNPYFRRVLADPGATRVAWFSQRRLQLVGRSHGRNTYYVTPEGVGPVLRPTRRAAPCDYEGGHAPEPAFRATQRVPRVVVHRLSSVEQRSRRAETPQNRELLGITHVVGLRPLPAPTGITKTPHSERCMGGLRGRMNEQGGPSDSSWNAPRSAVVC